MKKPRVFYGYWVLAACFAFTAIGAGAGYICFSFFITDLQADMGWSRTQIMAAFTLYTIFMGVGAPFAGKLIDRYGARKVILMGALVTSAGFVTLSQMTSLWHFYLGYCIIGLGSTAIGHITASYVVTQWFIKRRGMAMGIMSMGVGLSGVVFAPLVAVFLIPTFGWSFAYLALAAITAVIILPLPLFVIRTRPTDLGLLPDGLESHETERIAEAKTSAAEGLSLKEAMATPAFWLLAGYMALNHTHVGISQSVVPYLNEGGFTVGVSATAVSLTSMSSIASMFIFGWLCDRLPAKLAGAIGLGLMSLGALVLLNAGEGSPVWMVWLYAVLFGLGMGHWMPVMSMLVGVNFGMACYGTILGVLNLSLCVGSSIGPLLAGYMYDTLSYRWAFGIIAILLLVGIPLVLAARRPAWRRPSGLSATPD